MELWITCRMTHVFALATRLEPGFDGAAPLLDHGVESLLGAFYDERSGGWFNSLAAPDAPEPHTGIGPADDRKDAYAHAFVALAGASATTAGHPRGRELLDVALATLVERFWDDDAGMIVDSWDRDFTRCDDYRGINANMHAVEALLAAYDATGEAWPLDAATRIADRVRRLVDHFDGRLPEHFDLDWQPLLDFNRDIPADPFRPYGVTIGHLLEWARLLQQVGVAHERDGRAPAADSSPDLMATAAALTEVAVRDGWAPDGAEGFVYTTDFDGVPVVRERMHWVVAEAIANAWLRVSLDLDEATTRAARADHERWLAFAAEHLVDLVGGSWWHELGPDLRPSGLTWPDKPDVYHALQALWLPRLAPVGAPCVSFAGDHDPND